MTAINVIRQKQAVHVISDGVFCDSSGLVCEIGPNAFPLPHLPGALAIRGASHFMPFLVHRLSRECRSLDEALAKLVRIAQEVHLSFPAAFGSLGYGSIAPDFDLVAAGWSKALARPVSYVVSSHDRVIATGLTASPWQLVELPDILIAPPVAQGQITAVGWNVPYSAEAFQPEVDGVALVKAQRLSRRIIDPRSGASACTVGGFIQVTSMSSRGITSNILHNWSDELGRMIEAMSG